MHNYKVETQDHIYFLQKDGITDVLKDVPVALRVEGNFIGTIVDLRTTLEALPKMYACR